MIKTIFTLLIGILFLNGLHAQEKVYDLEQAKKRASEQNKTILMVFSGSDWCAPCIKLKKNIFESDSFKKYQQDNLVFLEVDFPKKKVNALSKNQQKINNQLAEKYNKEGIFPKVILLSKEGKQIGVMGYESSSPEKYIEKITAFIQK